MTYWQTQHFKALQSAWYSKLKQSGFEDAEELVGGELVLRQTSGPGRIARGSDEEQAKQKESYFYQLGQLVEGARFKNEVDKLILTMAAEGIKIQRIVETLVRAGKGRCRGTVRYTIRKYEMIWGLREYSPKQLNKKISKAG